MIAALLAGLALGGVYALAASGIVMSYISSGILNFAFAAEAYFIARLYYYLHIQHGWGIAPAAVLSVLVVAPALGVVLWAVLFRFLQLASSLIKIVVTIGLSVCLGAVTILLFGNNSVGAPPGLAPQPEPIYHVAGASLTLDQIIIYVCVIVVIGGGAAVLKFSEIGLQIRATVNSDAMTKLSGINPTRVAVTVWAGSTLIAGLAGVLLAPIVGLDLNDYTVLIAAAFAAVVAARLRSVGIAVAVGIAMGVVTTLLERYLPPTSTFTAEVIPSVPFIFIFLVIVYFAIRRIGMDETGDVGGPLDRAIAPQGGSDVALARAAEIARGPGGPVRKSAPFAALIGVVLLIEFSGGVWTGVVGLGLAYAIIFLSYTAMAGEGGLVWLCQITFAGIGAITTAELATNNGWPVIPAAIIGGLLCSVIGLIIGLLTLRLADIYSALVTLTFGLMVEQLVFNLPSINNYGAGITLNPPSFASSERGYSWMMLIIFCVMALLVATFRRSTLGLDVNAVRWSLPAGMSVGINNLLVKVSLCAMGAFLAGVGGAFYAMYAGAATPGDFSTFTGLIWLAVLVTVGVRSNSAALVAGLSFAFVPQIFTAYLSPWWGQIPPALFGLGAILVARNPEGTLAMHARQIEGLFKRDRRDPLAVVVAADQAEQPAAQAALASSQSPEEVPNR